jgi:hypothetical protein
VSKFAQTMSHLLRIMAASTVLIVFLSVSQSRADWPERPITIIVPFPRGGATDLLGRLLAARLTMRLGEPVAVENRVGEVGNVGLRAAAMATANGYTLLVTTNAALINLAINPRLSMTAYNTPVICTDRLPRCNAQHHCCSTILRDRQPRWAHCQGESQPRQTYVCFAGGR